MREPAAIHGRRVTVMGLGVHGGGLATARFFARRGAVVTVTDLRGPEALAPSIEALAGLPVRFVLGRHDEADFACRRPRDQEPRRARRLAVPRPRPGPRACPWRPTCRCSCRWSAIP